MQSQVTTGDRDSINSLNALLRGEISAVESYQQAIDRLEGTQYRSAFEECQVSHARRAQLLRNRVTELGGEPSETSGAWGAVTKLIERGATAFGEKAAINVLEDGEDRGLKDYERNMDKLDPESRRLVEQELLPAQRQSHEVISRIKSTMH